MTGLKEKYLMGSERRVCSSAPRKPLKLKRFAAMSGLPDPSLKRGVNETWPNSAPPDINAPATSGNPSHSSLIDTQLQLGVGPAGGLQPF